MDRLFAIINDNCVTGVLRLTEDGYRIKSLINQLVVDIEDMNVIPDVGWYLIGNQLVPFEDDGRSEEALEIDINKKKREFGCELVKRMADKLAARNVMLGKTMTQIAALLQSAIQIKLLLESGALETGRLLIYSLIAAYPEYADICQEAQVEIMDFKTRYDV